MKTVIYNVLIIITVLQILEAFWIFRYTQEEEDCIKQLNADKDKIRSSYLKYASPEDDTQFNHFMECVWKKQEYLTENGDVNYEKLKNSPHIVNKIGEDNIHILLKMDQYVFDAVSKCESNHTLLKADTAGVTAVRVQNCVVDNVSKAIYSH